MSAVEHKSRDFFNPANIDKQIYDGEPWDEEENDDWGTETMPIGAENFSYVLGKQGSTRKKLATASGCIIEYVEVSCVT